MKYYPAFLDVKNKKAVVIGGGKVAERKVRTLVRAGANVLVISPACTAGIESLENSGKVRCIRRNYRRGDLRNAFIAVAATSSAEINAGVAEDAETLVNVIDSPSGGNFIVPSVVRRHPLTIAISTEGTSPAVSKAIRKEIEKQYDREFSRYLKFLETVRNRAVREITDTKARERFLKSLASEEMFGLLRSRGFGPVSEKITTALERIKK